MTLYRYFERNSLLPKPHGSLSTVVPASTIAAANEAVKKILDSDMGLREKAAAFFPMRAFSFEVKCSYTA